MSWEKVCDELRENEYLIASLHGEKSRSLFLDWVQEEGITSIDFIRRAYLTLLELYIKNDNLTVKVIEQMRSQSKSFEFIMYVLKYQADSCNPSVPILGQTISTYIHIFPSSKTLSVSLIQTDLSPSETKILIVWKEQPPMTIPWDRLGELISILS